MPPVRRQSPSDARPVLGRAGPSSALSRPQACSPDAFSGPPGGPDRPMARARARPRPRCLGSPRSVLAHCVSPRTRVVLVQGVDLLVRHEWRHEDEPARASLGGELEVLAPPHPGPAANHVDHALQLAVMVRAGPRAGMDRDGPCPQLLRAPVRARSTAAARFIPGVCGVFESSASPGMTRTPSVRQSGAAPTPLVLMSRC